MRSAHEEILLELPLELDEAARDRLHSDVEFLGCRREASSLRNGDEICELLDAEHGYGLYFTS